MYPSLRVVWHMYMCAFTLQSLEARAALTMSSLIRAFPDELRKKAESNADALCKKAESSAHAQGPCIKKKEWWVGLKGGGGGWRSLPMWDGIAFPRIPVAVSRGAL